MRLEKAINKTIDGEYKERYLLVDDKFNIQEEALFFSKWLENNNYSPNTIEGYLRDLKTYFNFLEFKELKLNEVRPAHIVKFLDYLNEYEGDVINISKKDKKRCGTTINRMLASVSAFYKCLETADLTESSPFRYQDGVRPTGIYKSFLSHTKSSRTSERKFLKVKGSKNVSNERLFPNEVKEFAQGMESFRDALMVNVLYETGIRIGELIGLEIQDYSEIDPSEEFGNLFIVDRNSEDQDSRQKTGSRTLVVTMELLQQIEEYIIEYRPYIENSPKIFVAHKGKNRGLKLTRDGVEYIFRKCSEETGIKCHPHLLRHTHLTELFEAGFDQLLIKYRAGHSSIASTSRYTHLSLDAQTKAYGRFVQYRKDLRDGKN